MAPKRDKPVLAVVGAGNYASRVLIPAFSKAGARFGPIVTSGGLSGSITGEKFGFKKSTTDFEAALIDPEVDAVIIATRHDSHAELTAKALAAGKDVFVEKPLSIDLAGLDLIRSALDRQRSAGGSPRLMVGFNRRFAPHVVRMKALLDTVSAPKSFVMTMNAGAISPEDWTQDPDRGGGRIIGEACHLIDLMRYLAGHTIVSVTARRMGDNPVEQITEDKAFIILQFADGSHGVIHYLANGSKAFPKERIEVFTASRVLQLNNFRELRGYGWPGFRHARTLRQDKGQLACAESFYRSLTETGFVPIPLRELLEVAEFSIEATSQLRGQQSSHR